MSIQKLYILRESGNKAKVKVHKNRLIYKFEAQPTAISETYKLELNYHKNIPKVYLLGENIDEVINSNPPHVYGPNKDFTRLKLCLYYPNYSEWTSSDILVYTIIPWAVEWLFYYECWLATGEWNGGGIH